jgi:hypothetical protein
MFIALACLELSLGTGQKLAPSPPVPSDALFLSPTFVRILAVELAVMRGGAAAIGQIVDRLCVPISRHAPKGGAYLVCCGLLNRRGQGEGQPLYSLLRRAACSCARTTGIGSCPSPCLPSTTRLRPWATGSRPSSSTVVHTPACSCRPRRTASHPRTTHARCAECARALTGCATGAQGTLDVGRMDTVFQVGDRVLLRTKELLDAADIGKLLQLWD